MQAINANGVPVVVAAQPMAFAHYRQSIYSNMRNDYAKQLIILGSLQIVFGGLSIFFEAVSVGIYSTYMILSLAPLGYGFWTGIIFIITGPFGIVGGKRRNRCCVIAFNVLSVTSACFTAVLLILASISANLYSFRISLKYDSSLITQEANVGRAMESLMAIIAVAEAIVAIWSSVICCKIGGCCSDFGGQLLNVPHVQVAMTGQQQYPIINNGYNQQPQPQIMIAQQQMYQPMLHGQQPVYQQISHGQQPAYEQISYGQQPVYEQISYKQQSMGYDNSKIN